MILYAQPYDTSANGFYFKDVEDYERKMEKAVNGCGQRVEEFAIQFIDGEVLDAALAQAIDLNQCNFAQYLELSDSFDHWQKIRAIIAIGECGYCANGIDVNETFENIEVYEMDTVRELAEHFVEEGLIGDVPDYLVRYLDYDALARDLSFEYASVEIAGKRYVYASH